MNYLSNELFKRPLSFWKKNLSVEDYEIVNYYFLERNIIEKCTELWSKGEREKAYNQFDKSFENFKEKVDLAECIKVLNPNIPVVFLKKELY